jgi:DHA1 family bicyclomycin/chloramphenicol resistance-like MFS transporter
VTAALRRSWSLAAMLACLSMLGVFSIDLYLPAFPAIGSELHASPLALQQTLSVYLVTYAFMMLWHGALSDALGRRPVVLAGLVIYAIATLGCAIAGNIESLWLSRGLQGVSAGSGLVVGRAIARDCFHGAEAQRLMSQITLVFSLAPALAPVIGGLLLNAFGWRAIFWVLFGVVVALLGWCAARLHETLPAGARQTLRPRALWHNYRRVLGRPAFLLLALVPTLNFAAFFVYIAVAPRFLMDLLGVSTFGFGWLFLPMIAGVVIGAFASGRLAGCWSPVRTVQLGYVIAFSAVVLNIAICTLLAPRPAWNVLPIMLFTVGSSMIMPSVTRLTLDLFPTMRGLTSSLQGFAQFALAAVNAASIAPLLGHSLLTLALGMGAFTIGGYACWAAYRRLAESDDKFTSQG